MRRRFAPALCIAVLLRGAACAPKPTAPPSPPPAPTPPPAAELARSGLAVVKEADIVLRDSSRKREIPVHVDYPEGDGKFPVIVFSHGAGGSPRTDEILLRFWASHSFVVLAPSHADAASGSARDPAAESVREPAGDATHDVRGWESRVRDLSFVAAATAAVESAVPALQGRLDENRVGVAGRSYGAFAAMLLAGATVNVSRKERDRSFADPIPRAFVLISPPGRGQQGLTEKSWASVERPLMVVTGTRDPGVKNQDPSWRLDAYQLSPPESKFAVFIEGASHLSLTGLSAVPGAAPPKTPGKPANSSDDEVAIFKCEKIATLAFWDAYLKQDAAAVAFLKSDVLMTDSHNRAQLLRR